MNGTHAPSASDVGAMYDHFTDLFTASLGDNIHLGYWLSEHDDATPAAATDRLTDLVVDRLTADPATEVLDVGCGSGRATVRIAANRQVHVTGITVSAHQLRLARSRPECGTLTGQVSFELIDAMALPFPDGRFAGAYAIESIVHMSDRAKAIAEIARTLRPGATLVTSDFFLAGEPTAEATKVLTAAREPFRLPPFPDAREYRQQMTAAGLEVVAFEDITDNIHRSHQVIADTIRRIINEFDFGTDLRAQITRAADLTEQIATVPQLRYALTTARR